MILVKYGYCKATRKTQEGALFRTQDHIHDHHPHPHRTHLHRTCQQFLQTLSVHMWISHITSQEQLPKATKNYLLTRTAVPFFPSEQQK